jgi:plasmid stabilization system protein ParE
MGSIDGFYFAPAVTSDWEPPVPFAVYDVPPFPVEVLPTAIGAYVSEVALSTQIPADVAAMVAISALGAAGARFAEVQVGNTHTEPLNIWTISAMDPGDRKSACMEQMAAPIRDAERDMAALLGPDVAQAAEKRKIEEKRLNKLRTIAAEAAKPQDREAAVRELEELTQELAEVPSIPRLLADDITQEAMGTVLARNDGCIGIFSAEGGVFGMLAGRYSSSGKVNLDIFLKGHAGEEIRVDRIGRKSDFIPHAMITMALAVQPDVLTGLGETREFLGRGLVGRFLSSVPETLVGTRMYRNRPVSDYARSEYHRVLRALLAILPPDEPIGHYGCRHTLFIAGSALEQWTAYCDDVELRQAAGGDLYSIRDWGSKLAGAVARIAAGFHLARYADDPAPWLIPIEPETILQAWAVGQYLIPHALAAYGLMGADKSQALGKRIWAWIVRDNLAQFSLRDCHQALRPTRPNDIDEAVRALVDRGYIRPAQTEQSAGPGRRKLPAYEVNPLAINAQNAIT